MPDETTESPPEPPKRGKPGRKLAVVRPPDTRPLIDRVNEHYEKLRATDGTIAALIRKIDACERDWLDARNRAAVARVGIRTRETGLMREAFTKIQKEAGIRVIPGFKGPRENIRELSGANDAKLKLAEEQAKKILAGEPHSSP